MNSKITIPSHLFLPTGKSNFQLYLLQHYLVEASCSERDELYQKYCGSTLLEHTSKRRPVLNLECLKHIQQLGK